MAGFNTSIIFALSFITTIFFTSYALRSEASTSVDSPTSKEEFDHRHGNALPESKKEASTEISHESEGPKDLEMKKESGSEAKTIDNPTSKEDEDDNDDYSDNSDRDDDDAGSHNSPSDSGISSMPSSPAMSNSFGNNSDTDNDDDDEMSEMGD